MQRSAHSKKLTMSPCSQKRTTTLPLALAWPLGICALSTVFSTPAPNLTCCEKTFLDPIGCRRYAPCDSPRLKRAINEKVKVVGIIVLHVQTEESGICAILGIFKKLAVPVLLGTPFINIFIIAIFRSERKIFPFNSSPVPILMVNETETDKTKALTKWHLHQYNCWERL